jgi:hypothetical protein
MPITLEKFTEIKNKYGSMSSWAIWKEQEDTIKSGISDISFFENPTDITLNILKPNIILVGLNISKHIPQLFNNFHSDYTFSQDYKIRYAIKNTMFYGAYMTDIIKDFEEKVAGNLMKYLNKNKIFEKDNIQKFEEELSFIGSFNPIIIAFGNDSYKILNRNLKKYKIYKVSHYSSYINIEKYRLEFEKLEKDINLKIGVLNV